MNCSATWYVLFILITWYVYLRLENIFSCFEKKHYMWRDKLYVKKRRFKAKQQYWEIVKIGKNQKGFTSFTNTLKCFQMQC